MNIRLRPWTREDIPFLVRHANNQKVSATLRDAFPYPYTLEDAKNWIALQEKLQTTNDFAILLNDEPIGGIGIIPKKDVYRKTIEIGYWLGEDFWNKGIATEAVKLILIYIDKHFDAVRIVAAIFSNNPASMKVLEKNGFCQEAVHKKSIFKNNQILDEHVWVRFKLS